VGEASAGAGVDSDVQVQPGSVRLNLLAAPRREEPGHFKAQYREAAGRSESGAGGPGRERRPGS
jgi:hypothetical protein